MDLYCFARLFCLAVHELKQFELLGFFEEFTVKLIIIRLKLVKQRKDKIYCGSNIKL